jgi:hypothetical protein
MAGIKAKNENHIFKAWWGNENFKIKNGYSSPSSPLSHPEQAVANAKARNRDLPIMTQKSNNASVETNQF